MTDDTHKVTDDEDDHAYLEQRTSRDRRGGPAEESRRGLPA